MLRTWFHLSHQGLKLTSKKLFIKYGINNDVECIQKHFFGIYGSFHRSFHVTTCTTTCRIPNQQVRNQRFSSSIF